MEHAVTLSPSPLALAQPHPGRATLSALCASLVGIGLARFAYSPLIPALVAAGWFSASDAAYLGAANLSGYLLGALGGRPLARRIAPAWLLRTMMALSALSFFACAQPWGFGWFFGWRLASGIAGGIIMVLAATLVLPHVPPARRGLAGGAIFMGVGLGIAASGTLVPRLLPLGLPQVWGGLGALSLVLTLVAWSGWPRPMPLPPAAADAPSRRHRGLGLLTAIYGLNAIGLVPHMVFLVDYASRGLGRGIEFGAGLWVVFGLGAVLGPLATGQIGDRIGFRPTLSLALALQVMAVTLASLTGSPLWLGLSALVVGGFTPGIVPVVLGRIRELTDHDPHAQGAAWTTATAVFALGQAGGAYGLSWLFTLSGGDYPLLYRVGAGALALAFVLDLALMPRSPRP